MGDILDPVDIAEAALTWTAPGPDDVARLLYVVQSPAHRDQIMVQFAFGRETGVQAWRMNQAYLALQRATGRSLDDIVAAEVEGDAPPEAGRLGDLMLGQCADRPNHGRTEAAITLLKTVVASAPRRCRPAPLCMLAWLSWTLGRGSVAGIFVELALTIDPTYGMALLLNTVVCSGMLPEWAYAVPPDEAAS
ncbi:hypothetical protein JF66_01245 [Cryobacterium sp. MLB-32]|nr:hypothetical protein JF66_01245 [Cryobacterium sp. MLB-32]